jgi:diketogulonate reductase-like aldo/keto reductase
MRTIPLKSGARVPALGLGTWHMGEDNRQAKAEADALRLGLDLGMTLIDTAEMYGEGGAEKVVADAIKGRRDNVYIVSKVYPHNASRAGTITACERSLKRLAIDRIDLYLLHWRGQYPLAETVDSFERLKRDGKIRDWGVSNFDTGDMTELAAVKSGAACQSNQVLYHLGERGIEYDLLAALQADKTMVMAYSPLGQGPNVGPILHDKTLAEIAARHGVTPAAIALAFVIAADGVIAIPKATKPDHVRANAKALDVKLSADDRAMLDLAFPPPKRKRPLAMI